MDAETDVFEIAFEMRISEARVRQIQARALRKCRAWCAAHGYRLEDLLPDARDVIATGF